MFPHEPALPRVCVPRSVLALAAVLVGCASDPGSRPPLATPAPTYDLVIAGGRVMDPESGLDAVRNVGLGDGKILAISEQPLHGSTVIQAQGRVVAPGFIDLNTYQHGDPLFRLRAADGVTAVLNLEGGAVDISAYYDALDGRALLHYGTAVDHESARHIAQGDRSITLVDGVNEARGEPDLDLRALTEDEQEALQELTERGLCEGAVAIGFGVEYTPGATHTEILRLVELAARHDASAHLHLRNFDATQDWGQLYEVFGAAIATGGDLHVNHLNSVLGGYSARALEFLERARSRGLSITTECYPYTAGQTFIESTLFDAWESWPDERFERFEWPPTGERLTRETFARYREQGGVVVIHARDEAEQEAAVRDCLAHPLPMIASDGAWDEGRTHPRSAGTNSRVLGRYVREEGLLTLMEALRKMTLAPAQHLERRVPLMRQKGRLRVGADADLVVFDPTTVIDRATYRECTLPPLGIDAVLVLGVPVVLGGVLQEDVYPGRAIRGERTAGPAVQEPSPAQEETALHPVAYHPDRITTVNGIAFAPGGRELFVSRRVDPTDANGRERVQIFVHRRDGADWGAAEPVPFSDRYTDYQPVLSPDGERLFFTSTRPLPGTTREVRQNIWYADRLDEQDAQWSEPRVVDALVTPGWDGYAVPTARGNLYFVSEREGGQGNVDIWVARMDQDEFEAPRNVAELNTPDSESDLWVDPRERFLVFGRYAEATREIDLWISQREGEAWGAPRLLDAVNREGWELSPTVTPDQQSFFFQREGTLYQLDLALVVER